LRNKSAKYVFCRVFVVIVAQEFGTKMFFHKLGVWFSTKFQKISIKNYLFFSSYTFANYFFIEHQRGGEKTKNKNKSLIKYSSMGFALMWRRYHRKLNKLQIISDSPSTHGLEKCIQCRYEHLQRCSVCDSLQKYFSHPSLVMCSFATPPIKLKLGQQANRWGTTNSKPLRPIIIYYTLFCRCTSLLLRLLQATIS
jgi:hypothetical protein